MNSVSLADFGITPEKSSLRSHEVWNQQKTLSFLSLLTLTCDTGNIVDFSLLAHYLFTVEATALNLFTHSF